MEIEKLVTEATKGNKTALEGIAVAIQDNIYYLALRMLVNPEDARDATQEILVKVITNLSAFRFESQFNTWVYRIAANYLISEKKACEKASGLTFDIYKADLESDLQEPDDLKDNPQYKVLLNELRISCTMGMLLCLSPAYRMAYILGDIFDMEHNEASDILSISPANFRKQLSRARTKIVEFMSDSCGIVNNSAKCKCDKKLIGAINRNRVDANHIVFATKTQNFYDEMKTSLEKTQQDLKALALQKSINHYMCPIQLSDMIESLVVEGTKANKALHWANQ